ncbi:MAG: caspase family protein [Thermoplasmatales archaeon]|nr:MAG: caspase family protein [Thermoplasmatales archaeon]
MKKLLAIGIILLFIGMSVVPPTGGIGSNHNILIDNKTKVSSDEIYSVNNETEYWALLIAVGVYAGHPMEDRPHMLWEVEDLHEKLLVSEHWKEENIKVIKGRNATLLNILRGFKWLNKKEDKNDFSLVYINTHGGQLSRDRLPWDEKDGCDEILVTHLGFMFPWLNIRDDFLNLLLSLLNSKGVCVIIDSCYAGGFNDPPYFKNRMKDNRINANEWMHEFAEDLSESGRVVLMASQEDEVSYGGFTWYLTKGLTGYADANEDDLVSAEEAFDYAKERYDKPDVHATIYDDYTGELQLTEAEFPPSKPKTPTGQIIGETNTTYNYSTVSIDPEGGKISYGWDWDSDKIVDEWTDPVDSNTTVNTSHSWAIEGTYNLRVKAKDDHGLLSDWSNYIVVMMGDDHIPDQRQTIIDDGIGLSDYWMAQSFVPSLNKLSKVELYCASWGSGDPLPLHLYIRDNLSGDNLAETSRVIPHSYKSAWHSFDFEDLDVIPRNTYYIVCKGESNWNYGWNCKKSDCYPFGEGYYSNDGNDWYTFSTHTDFSFVTWGKI